MKKILALAGAVMLLAFSQNVFAQQTSRWKTWKPIDKGWGVVGSLTMSYAPFQSFWEGDDMMLRGRGGVAYKYSLGHGFVIQPQLMFNEKSVRLYNKTASDVKYPRLSVENGYIELPVQVQWGPQIPFGHLFVFAEPFVGFGINGYASGFRNPHRNEWKDCNMSRFEYGMGLGLGYELWHVQFSAQYSLNFGNLCIDPSVPDPDPNDSEIVTISSQMARTFNSCRNFGGIYFTMGFFF